ncbi:Collagen triple helix repeat-containing protein [Aphelenchoides besseyi]|nr:Collagen triple helix repeat-containing protein [Aphelenchoides besseyi]
MSRVLLFILYSTVTLTVISLAGLLILTPILLHDIDKLRHEWEQEFKSVRNVSNELWNDLQKMSTKIRVPRDRLRRQYDDYNFNGQQAYENGNSYDNYNSYTPPPPLAAPTYGYGLAKVKCCCAMSNIDYDGEHRSLPVSFKCPIGAKGPPGPPGEIGESGLDGAPGLDGEDYPAFAAPQSSANFGENDPYGGVAAKPEPEVCACPAGPKGKTGIVGAKGERGIQGVHGVPGIPGPLGPTGDVGVRGKTGRAGLPGPRGADAQGGGKGTPGRKGQRGSVGDPGPRGPTGRVGDFGRDGIRGRVGPRGIKGQRGLDGVDGVQGLSGVPGSDAGYCKCPERVRDVQVANSYGSPGPSYSNFGRSPSPNRSASPPAAVPTANQNSAGTSRGMEHRYGVVNEAVYNPQQRPGTRREHHPQGYQPGQQYPPQRSVLNYYNTANNQRTDYSSDQQSRVYPSANYNGQDRVGFNSDENPVVVQDWNDDVRRRQRLILAKTQRQRYFGRS